MFGGPSIYTSFVWNKDLSVFSIVCYVLLVIGLWRVFEKAGEEGWKALIPVYNFYILFKISGLGPMYFWLQLICSALAAVAYWLGHLLFLFYPVGWAMTLGSTVIGFMMWNSLSKAFGHGIGYAIGLWLVNPIFIMVLGYGSSRYYYRWNRY